MTTSYLNASPQTLSFNLVFLTNISKFFIVLVSLPPLNIFERNLTILKSSLTHQLGLQKPKKLFDSSQKYVLSLQDQQTSDNHSYISKVGEKTITLISSTQIEI